MIDIPLEFRQLYQLIKKNHSNFHYYVQCIPRIAKKLLMLPMGRCLQCCLATLETVIHHQMGRWDITEIQNCG